MKQCEPLKELLYAPKECATCPPGLGNRRRMLTGHVGIVTSELVAGLSDLVAVDVRTQELPKVPEILWKEPSPYYGNANIGKGHRHIGGRQDPKDYAKKKKAKRRQQKQARRKNK